MTRIVVVLCAGIIALDAVQFIVLRATGYSWYLWILAEHVLVYVGLGFFFRRRDAQLHQVVALGAIAAFVDAAFNRAMTTWVWHGADTRPFGLWLLQVPITMVFQLVLVGLGFVLGSIGKRARP